MLPISARGLVVAAILCAFPVFAVAVLPDIPNVKSPAGTSAFPNFDARVNNVPALLAAAAARPSATATMQARPAADVTTAVTARAKAAADFKSRFHGVTIEFSPGTLAPENVYADSGPLTAASAAPSFEIAKGYLRSERALYGLTDAEIDSLELLGESVSPSGLRMLRVRQVVNGRPVFLSETRVLLDAEGRCPVRRTPRKRTSISFRPRRHSSTQ